LARDWPTGFPTWSLTATGSGRRPSSNFLAGTIDRFVDDVVLRASTDPVKHMRLAAVQRCRPLTGAGLVASWDSRAAQFPDTLVAALVEQALSPAALTGWGAREALVSRGDDLAVAGLLARSGHAVAPDQLADRLGAIVAGSPSVAVAAAEALLAETAALAEARSGADLTAFRATLDERRRPIDPPPAIW
jgi:hypothetical protein